MKFQLSDRTYNCMKWACLIVAPALVTLLVTLTTLWGWNIPIEAITGSISAIATFLGVILGISNMNYNKEEKGVE